MGQLRRKGLAALTVASIATAAAAQDGSTTIVLDGSGSMWGQIDGVAKITIAQGALRELLGTIPEDATLGLVAYGHRERGQCADIQTLVSPDAGTRERILAQLDVIQPKGKTPLSDAVLHAAEGLVYTEERATVILISDGIETCDADPCAVGRRLEATGIDFTAHVIGFDVDGEAAAQLECLASETGGQFLLAEDAAELSGALQQVAVAPPPPPVPVAVTFRAELEDTGAPLDAGLVWRVAPSGDGEALLENEAVGMPVLELAPGSYTVGALWTETEDFRETTFRVEGGMDPFTVSVSFAAPQATATVSAPETAVAGSDIEVAWQGPGEDRDYVSVHTPGQDAYVNYSYIEGGSPTSLQMPIIPGQYEIRYYDAERAALATTGIEVEPVEVSLAPPAEAEVGAAVPIAWEGPDYASDYIAVAAPGDSGYVNYAYTRNGTPASLVMPGTPGKYEVR
ncbi:von Willebrand factor type A domain protein (plasmid) [Roseovarius sp. THAF9]|uniref:vWA domain-containing protein n=1 Tax=Roseovarius sp. THAF9 TaxID=2587847 RepID=UPI0012680D5D|nr:VWA domain-containing protein [Roseovarius sp. THAF9]QFT95240.1 von Willebrand factor type A domain protein [Roseovarius sp. THAF9]